VAGWVAVDLDGTLVQYSGWSGPEDVGKVFPAMLDRIHNWEKHGFEVRIFTARAGISEHKRVVEKWLREIGLGHLRVTNVKDYAMIQQWDDRAVQVVPNTGKTLEEVLLARFREELERLGASEDEIETSLQSIARTTS